jgi:hypothetical protein
MPTHDDTPTSSWSAPRLIALGAAQASQNGVSRTNTEDANYYPISPV